MMPAVTPESARDFSPAAAVLSAFALDAASLSKIGAGLINQTWLACDLRGTHCVLQRVNPVFPAQINYDIDVVTRHLRAKGLASPVLIRSRSGALWHEHDGAVWRLMSYVEGKCYEALRSADEARAAGHLLATFHRALDDLDYTFRNARLGVHDTERHLAALRAALVEHVDHPAFATIAALAAEVLELAADIGSMPQVPDRVVHGDPKISNIMFAADGPQALCLIDLDTIARMPVAFELGDAFRSWCNPKTEDASSATFDLGLFTAAIAGYTAGSEHLLQSAEWQAIPRAIYRITVELAARFCADALRGRYFAWDARRYSSASAHNQARTRGQLALARTVRAQRAAIEDIVGATFSRD
jgi:Ser/Thr protein kinase RdoA (MazF antagonist)